MEKIELEYLLEALNYGLNDCVDLSGNAETHYNQFANAIEVVQSELNLLTIPVVVKPFYCGSDYNHNAGRCKSQCRLCMLDDNKNKQ